MSDYHKELLMEIAKSWSDNELAKFLELQELRYELLRGLIKDLRILQKKRIKQPPLDTGARDGR